MRSFVRKGPTPENRRLRCPKSRQTRFENKRLDMDIRRSFGRAKAAVGGLLEGDALRAKAMRGGLG